MTPERGFRHSIVRLQVDGVTVDVATIGREGPLEPIVFLHGFGSTKDDYADIVHHRAFDGRPFLAWDAPGCGESDCGDLSKVSIPFLVATVESMLQAHAIERFHLVGHSMGGLTALMLAHAHTGRVLSFVDIEGNVAPEDCFLSRQIVDYPSDSVGGFSTTLSSAPDTPPPSPARCMRQACGTRSRPERWQASSARWWTRRTTAR
jgi:pimeloyl-ACP methyl ester carboxylesterase